MTNKTTTYALAAKQIGEYVQPLWQGAFALPFELRDEEGRLIKLHDDHLSGNTLLLVFLNNIQGDSLAQLFESFKGKQSDFDRQNIKVVFISADSDAQKNRQLKQDFHLPWSILGDSTGAIFASYGLHKNFGETCRVVMLTPLRQVRAWYDNPKNLADTFEEIMQITNESQICQSTPWSQPHAPILLIPNVLSAEECGDLIKSFETGAPFTVRPPRQGEFNGNYQIPVYEHNRQDRVDQIIKDQNTLNLLDNRIFARVTPMIKKAFAFDVTRREDLHIARYEGERSGNIMGHRDNTSAATAYRRFAFSMNLNDDYEGGEIKFKEYTQQGYRAAPGTAMVFSSSLLHEVMETTKGTRYNLISHFFNESTIPKR